MVTRGDHDYEVHMGMAVDLPNDGITITVPLYRLREELYRLAYMTHNPMYPPDDEYQATFAIVDQIVAKLVKGD